MAKSPTQWSPLQPGVMTNDNAGVIRISQALIRRISQAGITRIAEPSVYIPKESSQWS